MSFLGAIPALFLAAALHANSGTSPKGAESPIPPEIAETIKKVDEASLPFAGDKFTSADGQKLMGHLEVLMSRLRAKAPPGDPKTEETAAKLQKTIDKIGKALTKVEALHLPLVKMTLAGALSQIKKDARGLARTFPPPPTSGGGQNPPAVPPPQSPPDKPKPDLPPEKPGEDQSALERNLEADPVFAKALAEQRQDPRNFDASFNGGKLDSVLGRYKDGVFERREVESIPDSGKAPAGVNGTGGPQGGPGQTLTAGMILNPGNPTEVVSYLALRQSVGNLALEKGGFDFDGRNLTKEGRSPTDEEVRRLAEIINSLPLAANDPGFDPEVHRALAEIFAAQKDAYEKEFTDVALARDFTWTKDCRAVTRELCNALAHSFYKKGQRLKPEQEKWILEAIRVKGGGEPAASGHEARMRGLKDLPGLAGKGREPPPSGEELKKARAALAELRAWAQNPPRWVASNQYPAGDYWVSLKRESLQATLDAAKAATLSERQAAWFSKAAEEEAENWRKAYAGSLGPFGQYGIDHAAKRAAEDKLALAEREAAEFFSAAADALDGLLKDRAAGELAADPARLAEAKKAAAAAFLKMPREQQDRFAARLDELTKLLLAGKTPDAAARLNAFFDNMAEQLALQDPAGAGSDAVLYARVMRQDFNRSFGAGSARNAVLDLSSFVPGLRPKSADYASADLWLSVAFAVDALPFQEWVRATALGDWARDKVGAWKTARFAEADAAQLAAQKEALEKLLGRIGASPDGPRLVLGGAANFDFVRKELGNAKTSAEISRALRNFDERGLLGPYLIGQAKLEENLRRIQGEPKIQEAIKALAKLEGKELEAAKGELLKVTEAHPKYHEWIAAPRAELAKLKGELEELQKKDPKLAGELADFQGLRAERQRFLAGALRAGALPEGAAVDSEELGQAPGTRFVRAREGALDGYWAKPADGGPEDFLDADGRLRLSRETRAIPDLSDKPLTFTSRFDEDGRMTRLEVPELGWVKEGRFDPFGELVEGTWKKGESTVVYEAEKGPAGRLARQTVVETDRGGVVLSSVVNEFNPDSKPPSWKLIQRTEYKDGKVSAYHLGVDYKRLSDPWMDFKKLGLEDSAAYVRWMAAHRREMEEGLIRGISIDPNSRPPRMTVMMDHTPDADRKAGKETQPNSVEFRVLKLDDYNSMTRLIEEYWVQYPVRDDKGNLVMEGGRPKVKSEINSYAIYKPVHHPDNPGDTVPGRVYKLRVYDARAKEWKFKEREEISRNGVWEASSSTIDPPALAARGISGWGEWRNRPEDARFWEGFKEEAQNTRMWNVVSKGGEILYAVGDAIVSGAGSAGAYGMAGLYGAFGNKTAKNLTAINAAIEANRMALDVYKTFTTGSGDPVKKEDGDLRRGWERWAFATGGEGNQEPHKNFRTYAEALAVALSKSSDPEDTKWFVGDQRRKYILDLVEKEIASKYKEGDPFWNKSAEGQAQEKNLLRADYERKIASPWRELAADEEFAKFVIREGGGAKGGYKEIAERGGAAADAAWLMETTAEFGKGMAGGAAMGYSLRFGSQALSKVLSGARTDSLVKTLNSAQKLEAAAAQESYGAALTRNIAGLNSSKDTARMLKTINDLSSKAARGVALEGEELALLKAARTQLLSDVLNAPINAFQLSETVMTASFQLGDGDLKSVLKTGLTQAAFGMYMKHGGQIRGAVGDSLKDFLPPKASAEPVKPTEKNISEGVAKLAEEGRARGGDEPEYFQGDLYGKNRRIAPSADKANPNQPKALEAAKAADELVARANEENFKRRLENKDLRADTPGSKAEAQPKYEKALESALGHRESPVQIRHLDQAVAEGTLAPGVKEARVQEGDSCVPNAWANQLKSAGVDITVPDIVKIVRETPEIAHLADKVTKGMSPTEALQIQRAVVMKLAGEGRALGLKAVAPENLFGTIAREGRGASVAIQTGSGLHEVFVEGLVNADGKTFVSFLDSATGARTFMETADFAAILRSGGTMLDAAPGAKPGPGWKEQLAAFGAEQNIRGRAQDEAALKRIVDEPKYRAETLERLRNRMPELTEEGLLDYAKNRLSKIAEDGGAKAGLGLPGEKALPPMDPAVYKDLKLKAAPESGIDPAKELPRLRTMMRLMEVYLKERGLWDPAKIAKLEWEITGVGERADANHVPGRIRVSPENWSKVHSTELAASLIHEVVHELVGGSELPTHVIQSDFYLTMKSKLAEKGLNPDLTPKGSTLDQGLRAFKNLFGGGTEAAHRADLESTAKLYEQGKLQDYIRRTYDNRKDPVGVDTSAGAEKLRKRYANEEAAAATRLEGLPEGSPERGRASADLARARRAVAELKMLADIMRMYEEASGKNKIFAEEKVKSGLGLSEKDGPAGKIPDQLPEGWQKLRDDGNIPELAKKVEVNKDSYYRGLGFNNRADLEAFLKQAASGGLEPKDGMAADPTARMAEAVFERAIAKLRFDKLFPGADARLDALIDQAKALEDSPQKAAARKELKERFLAKVKESAASGDPKVLERLFRQFGDWTVMGSPVPRDLIQFVFKGGDQGQGAGSSLSFAVEKSAGGSERYAVLLEIDPAGLPGYDISKVRTYEYNPQEIFILGKIPPQNIKAVIINGKRFTLAELAGP